MTYSILGNTLFDTNVVGYFSNVNIDGGGALIMERSLQGKISGYYSGGNSIPGQTSTTIMSFPFITNANATNVGNLAVGRQFIAGNSSETHGFSSGGRGPSPAVYSNDIEKFPFAAQSFTAVNTADLLSDTLYAQSHSSLDAGFISGNLVGPTSASNSYIQRFSFVATSNAVNVGDLTTARVQGTGHQSRTHGFVSRGNAVAGGALVSVEKFSFFASATSAVIGNFSPGFNSEGGGNSSKTDGYTASETPSTFDPFAYVGSIDKFPFATDFVSTRVGNLTVNRRRAEGTNSENYGYIIGGQIPPSPYTNIIDRFSFASGGSATDVGDMTAAVTDGTTQQY